MPEGHTAFKVPTCASYKTVQEAVNDKLFPVKMAFFAAVTSQMSPFLAIFQSSHPLVPFLARHLEKMIRKTSG
jgi:hypothetical protein